MGQNTGLFENSDGIDGNQINEQNDIFNDNAEDLNEELNMQWIHDITVLRTDLNIKLINKGNIYINK